MFPYTILSALRVSEINLHLHGFTPHSDLDVLPSHMNGNEPFERSDFLHSEAMKPTYQILNLDLWCPDLSISLHLSGFLTKVSCVKLRVPVFCIFLLIPITLALSPFFLSFFMFPVVLDQTSPFFDCVPSLGTLIRRHLFSSLKIEGLFG